MNWEAYKQGAIGAGRGALVGFKEGAVSIGGYYRAESNTFGRNKSGKWGIRRTGPMVLGGKGGVGALGLGLAKGAGAAAFLTMATGDPVIGSLGWLAGGRYAMPAFAGMSLMQGYREGGVGGAVAAVAKEAMIFGAFEAVTTGFKYARDAFKTAGSGKKLITWKKGAPVGLPTAGPRGILGTITSVGGPLLTAAAIGYTAYKGARALADYNREHGGQEFIGNMRAFNTRNAHTMRQRAMQEIQRSQKN
jgi:hypothetical protein